MRILTLANPGAAGGRALRYLDAFLARHAEMPHEFVRGAPASVVDLRSRIRSAGEQDFDAVMLVGGDGTLHAALPALLEARIPFGLLPLGRGNDFAQAVGIPRDPGTSVYYQPEPATLDVHIPSVNDVPYATVASLGFDAAVGKLAQERKGWLPGTLGYLMCVLRALREWRPLTARITVDDSTWSGRILAVAVANTPFYGGGMRVAPPATPSDDLLHAVVLEELPKRELLPLMVSLLRGRHTAHSRIRLFTGRSIEVEAEEERDLLADGEWLGRANGAGWSAGGNWLSLILPDELDPRSG